MALKLGELLLSKKLFSRRQLEEALEAQAVFGGRLGSILIEMGAIGELDLAQVLSSQLEVPFASPDQLVDIPAAALNALPPELAQKYQALPIRLENRTLTVVMVNPRDLKSVEDLSFCTGYVIRPILAPELRLSYALEHYYRLPRKRREYNTHPSIRKELARLEKGGKDAAMPIAAPLPEPDLDDLLSDPADLHGAAAPHRPVKPSVVSEARQLDDLRFRIPTDNQARTPVPLKSTARQLSAVSSYNDIAVALLHYLSTRYSRTALLRVSEGQAIGWNSAHNKLPITGFENFRFSLDSPSAMQTAVASQKYFSGSLSSNGTDLALRKILGEPAPVESLVHPIILRDRVMCLIYLDDPQLDPDKALPDLQKLANLVPFSFELLAIKHKILRMLDGGS